MLSLASFLAIQDSASTLCLVILKWHLSPAKCHLHDALHQHWALTNAHPFVIAHTLCMGVTVHALMRCCIVELPTMHSCLCVVSSNRNDKLQQNEKSCNQSNVMSDVALSPTHQGRKLLNNKLLHNWCINIVVNHVVKLAVMMHAYSVTSSTTESLIVCYRTSMLVFLKSCV